MCLILSVITCWSLNCRRQRSNWSSLLSSVFPSFCRTCRKSTNLRVVAFLLLFGKRRLADSYPFFASAQLSLDLFGKVTRAAFWTRALGHISSGLFIPDDKKKVVTAKQNQVYDVDIVRWSSCFTTLQIHLILYYNESYYYYSVRLHHFHIFQIKIFH